MPRGRASPGGPGAGQRAPRESGALHHGPPDGVGHVAERALVPLQSRVHPGAHARQRPPSLADDFGQPPPAIEPLGHESLEQVGRDTVIVSPAPGPADRFHQTQLREQACVGARARLADAQVIRQLIETQLALAQEQKGEHPAGDRRLPLILEQGRETVREAGGAWIHGAPGRTEGRGRRAGDRSVWTERWSNPSASRGSWPRRRGLQREQGGR